MTETREELRGFIARCLPFLEEAWAACFRGQKEMMLSAEERGMGGLIRRFRLIAKGRPCLPIGLITQKEASRQRADALKWARKMLGQPNELKEPLRQYVHCGETCADGIKRAHKRVKELEEIIEDKRDCLVQVVASLQVARTLPLEPARDLLKELENLAAMGVL